MNLFKDKYYLENNLFDANFIDTLDRSIDDFNDDISDIFDQVKNLWDKEKFKKSKEATLEVEFIHPLINLLGYEFIYRERISFQGQSYEPDNTLFRDKEHKEAFEKNKSALENILLFCESKGYKEKLDTKSKDKKLNPHYQLLDYLKTFKIDYGFLTNGHTWRFYDNSVVSTTKTYYEIDLEAIIERDDLEAFRYFYFIFRKDNFYVEDERISHEVVEKNNSVKTDVEIDLKNVIYGTDRRESIFEIIGKSIYEVDPNKSLYDAYENTLYLVFRLLFIAYFEDKNKKLLELHRYYNDISLNTLYKKLEDPSNQQDDRFNLYGDLKRLFRILNEGDESYEVPLFNGGLFNPEKAPLLEKGKLLNNKQLFKILNSLLIFDYGNSLFRRDFKNLSIINLGSIYEGLLEYRFEIAQEDLYYIEYKSSKKSTKIVSGYMDTYDYNQIKKQYITKENYYKAGEVYLTNSSNSRKATASYYTPPSLSSFMVKSAIDLELNKGKKPIDLKILDNSCGSGHFLLESLAYLTEKAIIGLDDDTELQGMIEDERVKIKANLIGFDEEIEVSDYDIVKRLLLKKTIFGVDLNPFSVELTKLALWIDSFIFGTPLSFLAHHIKQGNSLIGSSLSDFKVFMNKHGFGLFQSSFEDEFEALGIIYSEIDNLQDTTAQEINKSKDIFENKIEPTLKKLNNSLNLITMFKFESVAGHKKILTELKLDTSLLEGLFEDKPSKALDLINKYQQEYSFFNYEIEFPEMTHLKGFDIVIGNPPWDKTKLDDKDFFSQYRSDYRTLKDKKKKEVKDDLLSKKAIADKYNYDSKFMAITNEYLKANYPLNKGVGDGNLFRFFVENNLKLLRENGNLTYVLPSALFQEDGSTNLRREIFDNHQLNYFYGFENRNKIFEIDSRYKFGIFQAQNTKPLANHIIKSKFMQLDTNTLYNEDGLIDYDIDTIKKFSPNHLALADITNKIVFDILKKAYTNFKSIDPAYIDFRNELHMTSDKDLFQEQRTDTPLYEGKMIYQFDNKFKEPTRFLKLEEFDTRLQSKEIDRMAKDLSSKSHNIKVTKKDIEERGFTKYIKYDREYFRFGFRAIASDTNDRTLIATLLSKNVGIGHSMYAEVPKKYHIYDSEISYVENSSSKKLLLLSIFNSIIVDFILRLNVSTNVSKTYLMRLPIPQPKEEELKSNESYQKLIINALKLTLYFNFDDFKELADEYKLTKDDLPTTPKQVDMLKIENDIIVAKMYDIEYKELEHILSTFKVFNKKYPAYISTLLSQYKSERS